MKTSYDEIFTCFIENCKGSQRNIPTTNEGKYAMIHNAIRHYENKMEDEFITYDDMTETINKKLDNSRLLILAYCIKLIYHENELTEFTSIYSTLQKEIGFKDYREQIKARESNITRTEQKITELITNIENFTIMGE